MVLNKVKEGEDYNLGQDIIDKTPHIIKLLKFHKKSKKSVIEILCKDSNYTIDSKLQLVVFDEGTRLKTVGELLEREYGIRRDSVKCNKCGESFTTDTIIYHMESGWSKGHRFSIAGITDFLATIAY